MEITSMQNGSICFNRADGEDEQRDFFEATFLIACVHGNERAAAENTIRITLPVQLDGSDHTYRKVEDLAAQALPAFFRDLADAIEQENAEVSSKRAAEQAAKGEQDSSEPA